MSCHVVCGVRSSGRQGSAFAPIMRRFFAKFSLALIFASFHFVSLHFCSEITFRLALRLVNFREMKRIFSLQRIYNVNVNLACIFTHEPPQQRITAFIHVLPSSYLRHLSQLHEPEVHSTAQQWNAEEQKRPNGGCICNERSDWWYLARAVAQIVTQDDGFDWLSSVSLRRAIISQLPNGCPARKSSVFAECHGWIPYWADMIWMAVS